MYQASDKDSESPDSYVSSLYDRTDRHPDRKSGQNPDSRQKIRTESGQQTDTVPEKPATIFRKIQTKTRQGQDTDSAVRLGCSVVLNAL